MMMKKYDGLREMNYRRYARLGLFTAKNRTKILIVLQKKKLKIADPLGSAGRLRKPGLLMTVSHLRPPFAVKISFEKKKGNLSL
jgi:hypothetical protein